MPSFVVTVAMVSSFSDRMCSSQERVRERPTTHADYTRHARRETLRPGYNSAYESGASLGVRGRNQHWGSRLAAASRSAHLGIKTGISGRTGLRADPHAF